MMIHTKPDTPSEPQHVPVPQPGRANVFEDWMRMLSRNGRTRLMEHLRQCVARQVNAMHDFGRPDPMRILAQAIVNAYLRESDIEFAELRMLLDDPIAHAQVAILNLALDHISDANAGINGRPANPPRRRRRHSQPWMEPLPPYFE